MLCYSKREKVVKFLQSNPVQILLCVIVLLDAGIVIAQILLDLNSVKGESQILNILLDLNSVKGESQIWNILLDLNSVKGESQIWNILLDLN